MKKSNLIRSDQPHTVNVSDGSNVAQRKKTQKSSAPAQDETPVTPNVQKVEPVKASKPRRVSAPPPTTPAPRAKAPPKAVAQTAPAPKKARTARPKAVAQPQAAVSAAPPLPPSLLWEQDNPVKQRIDQLRIRNAQLAEQLQRLSNSPSARGQRP